MNKLYVALCAGAMLYPAIWPATTFAQSWQPPTPEQRCLFKWGAADERGAANHMRPDTVLRAT